MFHRWREVSIFKSSTQFVLFITVSLDPMSDKLRSSVIWRWDCLLSKLGWRYEEPWNGDLDGRTSSEWKNKPVCSDHAAELARIDSDDRFWTSFRSLNSLAFCSRLNLSCSKAMEEFISLLILKRKGTKKKKKKTRKSISDSSRLCQRDLSGSCLRNVWISVSLFIGRGSVIFWENFSMH